VKKFLSLMTEYLKKSDTLLLVLCVTATVFGTVLISSAVRYTGSNSPVYVQILALVCGVILYFLFSIIDIDIFAARWRLLYVGGLLAIASLFVLGVAEGGNRAWIRFGGIGIQPAEVVKIIFIIILARCITRFSEDRRLNHVFSVAGLVFVFASFFGLIIVASSDLGSALVYCFVFLVMLFAGGLKLYWFFIALGVFVVAAPYIWNNFLTDTHKERILVLFDPTAIDPSGQNATWQVNRSKMALASGRIFGTGLYEGTQTQAGAIPRQRTDFIFTVAGEELGLVGCAAIILLLLAIIIRCVYIGIRSQSRLGALVCIGVAGMLAFQTFINIGMCIGITPVIGVTLPFFSSGGSSIITSFAAMGLVSGIKMKPKPTMFKL